MDKYQKDLEDDCRAVGINPARASILEKLAIKAFVDSIEGRESDKGEVISYQQRI